MSLVRFASLLILVLWIGGLATLGFVGAPAIFDVLEARDPAAGRTLAAAVFGAVLARFHQVSWVLGALLLGVLGMRAVLGPRPRRFGLRMWTTGADARDESRGRALDRAAHRGDCAPRRLDRSRLFRTATPRRSNSDVCTVHPPR